MEDFDIRPVSAGDLAQLLGMVRDLAARHGDQASIDIATLRRDVLGPEPWIRVLVAAHAAQLVGYAALCPLAQLQFGRRGMDMQNLFVVSPARGRGSARR